MHVLRAINPEKNIFREYAIDLTKDMLGYWVVMTSYGRIGARGQSKQYAFKEKEAAEKKINEILNKRLKSKSRIGCDYGRYAQTHDTFKRPHPEQSSRELPSMGASNSASHSFCAL
jgi:predicted DNA-binding WGR domain protein